MKTNNRTTLFIDSKIMDTIKQIAVNKDTTQTKIINDYLKQGIEKEPTNKFKIRFIVKPDPTKNIDDIISSIEAPNEFNPLEAIREIRTRKS
ncbi:MAG: hypothetical protein LBT66_09010 [Methanobrevibacter sp.]|jgi:flagellar biosynthesis/type III secretory pathway protein FliH|nr:hypothetical protein [Candidatus Methanovirga meridionalis]